MPLGNRVKSDALSTVYTDQVYALGTTYVQLADEVDEGISGVNTAVTSTLLQGERTWIFVKANAAIAAGDLCKRNAITTPYVAAKDDGNETDAIKLVGVADHAIDAGKYGWIIARGMCVVQTKGGVSASALLASDGNTVAGEVDTWTAGAGLSRKIIGIANEAEGGGAEYGAGFVVATIDLLI